MARTECIYVAKIKTVYEFDFQMQIGLVEYDLRTWLLFEWIWVTFFLSLTFREMLAFVVKSVTSTRAPRSSIRLQLGVYGQT
jgi:hypothetical protein